MNLSTFWKRLHIVFTLFNHSHDSVDSWPYTITHWTCELCIALLQNSIQKSGVLELGHLDYYAPSCICLIILTKLGEFILRILRSFIYDFDHHFGQKNFYSLFVIHCFFYVYSLFIIYYSFLVFAAHSLVVHICFTCQFSTPSNNFGWLLLSLEYF